MIFFVLYLWVAPAMAWTLQGCPDAQPPPGEKWTRIGFPDY
jgi:hypothetical protein